MLWELITAIGAMAFVVAGLQSARQAHAGIGWWVLVITIGLVFAVSYEWGAHKLADVVDDRLKGRSQSLHKWCVRGFVLASTVFPVFAAVVGGYVSSTVLRLRWLV